MKALLLTLKVQVNLKQQTKKKKKKNQLSTNQAIMTENKYINSTIISPNKKNYNHLLL